MVVAEGTDYKLNVFILSIKINEWSETCSSNVPYSYHTLHCNELKWPTVIDLYYNWRKTVSRVCVYKRRYQSFKCITSFSLLKSARRAQGVFVRFHNTYNEMTIILIFNEIFIFCVTSGVLSLSETPNDHDFVLINYKFHGKRRNVRKEVVVWQTEHDFRSSSFCTTCN